MILTLTAEGLNEGIQILLSYASYKAVQPNLFSQILFTFHIHKKKKSIFFHKKS